MARTKHWAFTDLSKDASLVLEIAGESYDVVQFSMAYSLNQIPRASCMLAIGRDARFLTPAKIHETANTLSQMVPAKITFKPEIEWEPNGTKWPDEPQIIFEGYYTGMAYRKHMGKVSIVVHLSHYLIDLACSSTLSGTFHPNNPASLIDPAVYRMSDQGSTKPIYIAEHWSHGRVMNMVENDLWSGIKDFLEDVAADGQVQLKPDGQLCLGSGLQQPNERALRAFDRIEGGTVRPVPYEYSKPMAMQTEGNTIVNEAVAGVIGLLTLESFASQTMWDLLLGPIAAQFNCAIIPRPGNSLFVADTPGFHKPWHKPIKVGDYDTFDTSGAIPTPLRGVAIMTSFGSETGLHAQDPGAPPPPAHIGGCFVADAETIGDGVIRYLNEPPWLANVGSIAIFPGYNSALIDESGQRTATSPGATPPDPPGPTLDEIRADTQILYDRYAHSVFVNHALKSRAGSISGKLRFDIAPGSIVQIETKAEPFLEGIDELAVPMYGCVSGVVVSVNCEASIAGTTINLTHLRTEKENSHIRTSTTRHPLFGTDIYNGSPLIEAWEFPK